MILLGIDAFYLVWLDFTLRKLELDHRLEDGYVSSFEEVITGHYINDMWPLHAILLALGLFGAISLLGGIIEYIASCFTIKEESDKKEETETNSENPKSDSKKRITWTSVILFVGAALFLWQIVFPSFPFYYGLPMALAIVLAIYLFIKGFIPNKHNKENADD